MKIKELLKLSFIPVLTASLCCLSPVILVLLGFSTVSAAASLSDNLYGEYKWIFRGIGIILLAVAVILHLRKKNICTLDQAKRRFNEVANTIILSIIIGVLGYIFFLYVVVHYIGVFLKIWS